MSRSSVRPDCWSEQEDSDRLDRLEARHIQAVLKKTGGKVSGKGGAAELLGINPNTLRHRMRKMGVSFGRKLASGKAGI